jgi:hypothetical protein
LKHKHAELIKAWADGARIEYKDYDSRWYIANNPMWHDNTEYRIKPEPQEELAQPNIQIFQLKNQLQNARVLIKEQDEKICELATKLAYANKSIEILNEEKEEYLYVYNDIDTSKTMMSPTLMRDTSDWDYMGKVRVEK